MEDMFSKKPPRKVRSFSEAWKQTTGAKIAAAMAIGSIPMFIIFAQNVRSFMDSFGSGMGIMFPVFGMLAVFTLPVLLLACRFGLLGYPKIVREEEIFYDLCTERGVTETGSEFAVSVMLDVAREMDLSRDMSKLRSMYLKEFSRRNPTASLPRDEVEEPAAQQERTAGKRSIRAVRSAGCKIVDLKPDMHEIPGIVAKVGMIGLLVIFFIVFVVVLLSNPEGAIEEIMIPSAIWSVALTAIGVVAMSFSLVKDEKKTVLKKNRETYETARRGYESEMRLAQTEPEFKTSTIESNIRAARLVGADAMRTMAGLMEKSVYQEKEADWAIIGGAVSGLAGGFAGVAAAVDTMAKNQEIRARNAANQAAATQTANRWRNIADQQERDAHSMRFDKAPTPDLTLLPSKVMERVTVDCKLSMLNFAARTVELETELRTERVQVDGSMCYRLYTGDKLVGLGVMALPMNGVSGYFCGTVTCLLTRNVNKIDMIEPDAVDLWLVGTGHGASPEATQAHKQQANRNKANVAQELRNHDAFPWDELN